MNVAVRSRGCSLATLLTTLCLVDLDLNGKKGNVKHSNNAALSIVENNDLDYKNLELRIPSEVVDKIKETCRSVTYLVFHANPTVAGFGYFNAARDAGYDKMMMIPTRGTTTRTFKYYPKFKFEWEFAKTEKLTSFF